MNGQKDISFITRIAEKKEASALYTLKKPAAAFGLSVSKSFPN